VLTICCRLDCERRNEAGAASTVCSAGAIEIDHVPDAGELAALLKQHGYVADRDGNHWCKAHDPADKGAVFTLTGSYSEIAPGIFARVPPGLNPLSLFGAAIEVRHAHHSGEAERDGRQ
jgi:hypothetical protein